MGLNYRKRVKVLPGVHLNLSKSGPSISESIGPVTVNSKGRETMNLGHGLRYQTSAKTADSTSAAGSPSSGVGKTIRIVFSIVMLIFAAGALLLTAWAQGWI